MPIYEYRCLKCGHEFEERRSFSQTEAPARCPRCGGDTRKLVTSASSKVDFYYRPTKKPFRGPEPTPPPSP